MHAFCLWLRLLAMLSKRKRPYDESSLPPTRRLAANIKDLVGSNELSAARAQSLVNDAYDSGARGFTAAEVRDPDGKNVARDLRAGYLKQSQWPKKYWAKVRCKQSDGEVAPEWVAFWLPHELLACLHQHGSLEMLQATAGMDVRSLQHLDKCKQAQGDSGLVGMGLHGDGVPCNWDRTASVETLSLNFPGLPEQFARLRLPIVAIPHASFCEYTWDDVMEVVAESLKCAAAGKFMVRRFDNLPWKPSDTARSKLAGKDMGVKGVLVEARGDWKYFAETFKVPRWNNTEGICWKCNCTLAQDFFC